MRWEGGRLVRWEGGEGGRVVKWQGGRMVKQKGGKDLVLLKGEGHKMSPRFHLFVYDVNQGNKRVACQDFLAWLHGWKDSP